MSERTCSDHERPARRGAEKRAELDSWLPGSKHAHASVWCPESFNLIDPAPPTLFESFQSIGLTRRWQQLALRCSASQQSSIRLESNSAEVDVPAAQSW